MVVQLEDLIHRQCTATDYSFHKHGIFCLSIAVRRDACMCMDVVPFDLMLPCGRRAASHATYSEIRVQII